MRDENYYREKQERIDQMTIPTLFSIKKSFQIKQRAIALISDFFSPPEIRIEKTSFGHKRARKQRLIRRYKHACRMRNAA